MRAFKTTDVWQRSTGFRLITKSDIRWLWYVPRVKSPNDLAYKSGRTPVISNPIVGSVSHMHNPHWGPPRSCLNHVARQSFPLLEQREADSNRLLHDVFRQNNEVAFVITMWCVFLKPFSPTTTGQHEGRHNMYNIQFLAVTISEEEIRGREREGFVKCIFAFSLSIILHKDEVFISTGPKFPETTCIQPTGAEWRIYASLN